MRLIDADELLEHVWRERLDSRERIEHLVVSRPTITPEPKRGRWIKHEDRAGWYCSECATDDYYAYFHNSDTGVYELQDKFCPNCGADMRGEKRVND